MSTQVHVRRAGPLDCAALADLLNPIIRAGGTTALTREVTAQTLREWMAAAPDRSAWHLAEDDRGIALGFQFIEPGNDLPPEACDIATFVRMGQTGLGIGSGLFAATVLAARALGYGWINATIRADNAGGLAYYQSRGFDDYARLPGVAMADGRRVDRICKRHDL